jgi:hypothetical protein
MKTIMYREQRLSDLDRTIWKEGTAREQVDLVERTGLVRDLHYWNH